MDEPSVGFDFFADTNVVMPVCPTMLVAHAVRSVNAFTGLANLESGALATKTWTTTTTTTETEPNAIQRELDRQYPDVNRPVGVEAVCLIK
jgi:hypothetical protein